MSNEDIIKFIKDNCRDCNEVDREMEINCEYCYLLKEFLEQTCPSNEGEHPKC